MRYYVIYMYIQSRQLKASAYKAHPIPPDLGHSVQRSLLSAEDKLRGDFRTRIKIFCRKLHDLVLNQQQKNVTYKNIHKHTQITCWCKK
jgi:hypothetical protein